MSFKLLKRNLSFFSKEIQDNYDIIISGGGMVGLSLACALGKEPILNNRSVLLIESSEKPTSAWSGTKDYSNRVSSINPKSKRFFKKVDMWKHIEAARFQTVKNIKVWGSYSNLSTDFSVIPGEEMAYIIENDVIIDSAVKLLSDLNNVHVLYGNKIQKVDLGKEVSSIVIGDGKHVTCKLLVGADGGNSLVRKSMNVKFVGWSYSQMGVVGTLYLNAGDTAWQRFLKSGPIALLPLNKELCSLVWSTPVSDANLLMKMSDDEFVDALNSALSAPPEKNELWSVIENTLGRNEIQVLPPLASKVVAGSRAMFPLGLGHAAEYVKHNCVLVGDAAHRVHPLAGQGVNLGLNDVCILTDCLANGVRNGHPLPCSSVLNNYETQALRHNLPLMASIEFLHRVFVSQIPFVNIFSSASFLVAQKFTPLKHCMRSLASTY